MTLTVFDAFCGAGGWAEGARALGLSPIGIELDEWACKTARAAGHRVIRQDVTTFSALHLRGRVRGLIASPPCTDFSIAGRRAGIEGETGRLIYEVPRLVSECEPEWIACEQEPCSTCGGCRFFPHLDTRRDQREDGSTQTRDLDAPAPAVTGKAGGQWVFDRPSTTFQSTDRIAKPGHHDRQWNGAIKVTLEELVILQSFPADYLFIGTKSARSLQVGNAIPPLLARAVLSAVTGIAIEHGVAA